MTKQSKLLVRNLVNSEIGEAMVVQGINAFQDFGREVLDRDFEIISSDRPFPDIRDYISNGTLDRDAYHNEVWRFYNSHQGVPVFSLDIVDVPIITEFYGQVNATSCPYIHPDSGKVLSPNHQSVILSTTPLFLGDDIRTAEARAYLLTWHENGHLVYGSEVCSDEQCIMSHPRDKQKSLDEKVSNLLAGSNLPLCDDCKSELDRFREMNVNSRCD